MAETIGGLAEAARKRKETLLALRKKSGQGQGAFPRIAMTGRNVGRVICGLIASQNAKELESPDIHKRNAAHFPDFVDEEDSTTREQKVSEEAEEQNEPPKKVIKFRNYAPRDDTLKEKKIPDTKPQSVEENVKEHLEKAKPEAVVEEVDLTNLAPRKPDWDLKRDVSKKLEKLERRTQRAIAELIRERLQGNNEELASAVSAMTE